ncbi:MAG: UDP-N-acetylmuramate dehydrogenase [Candidatus Pacebacteria bacterium]|nr:UDP-N-acetylmuramate dehydrogenase [Candidatus Paceibacterota bacterium]
MKILEHVSLQPYTTFMTQSEARYFTILETLGDFHELIKTNVWVNNPYILGGGSNILFTKDYNGLIVVNKLSGKEIVYEDEKVTDVEVFSGESWSELVLWSVEKDYWGIENLALIPGTVGAAPVQNIGAYGVEAKDTIISVKVYDFKTNEIIILGNSDCNFGYRDSIFKQEPHRYFVISVTFRLSKIPRLNLEYGAIVNTLKEHGITDPSAKDMASVVTEIRQRKLPDVGEIGMAGSFFKNPVILEEHFQTIQQKYPDMPFYELENGQVKIPAGWIIETLGYKGIKEGNVGTYDKHALVLVNYGNATGEEVWDFAQKIIKEVKEQFDIIFEPEVIIL